MNDRQRRLVARILFLQADFCKHILKVYRQMVINLHLSDQTWIMMLRFLIFIASIVMTPKQRSPDSSISFVTAQSRITASILQVGDVVCCICSGIVIGNLS